jgi:hypothetical protein
MRSFSQGRCAHISWFACAATGPLLDGSRFVACGLPLVLSSTGCDTKALGYGGGRGVSDG